jgi:hypothetical protein
MRQAVVQDQYGLSTGSVQHPARIYTVPHNQVNISVRFQPAELFENFTYL